MKSIKLACGLSVFAIFCLIACQKESLFPELPNLKVASENQPPPPTVLILPASTKWIKKKADRKLNELISIISVYYNIPEGGLLEVAAYCTNRLEMAGITGVEYELLTLATELEDLKRIGIDNEQAALLQGALYFKLRNDNVESPYSLDIEEVSKQDANELTFWIQSFIEEHKK